MAKRTHSLRRASADHYHPVRRSTWCAPNYARLSVTGRRIWWVILCSVFIMGAANLAATWWYVQTYKHDQQQQGQLIARKLCTTLDRLAALQPPAGNPTTNPSRAYDQRLHSTLADLGPDIGLSVMDQYFPAYKAHNDPELSRRLTWAEYREALDIIETLPFEHLFLQEDLAMIDTSDAI